MLVINVGVPSKIKVNFIAFTMKYRFTRTLLKSSAVISFGYWVSDITINHFISWLHEISILFPLLFHLYGLLEGH